MKLKHILVGTDLSPRADMALARAAELSRQHGARLSALHVLPEPLPNRSFADLFLQNPGSVEAELVLDARRRLEQQLITTGATECTAVVQTGTPLTTIVQSGRDQSADLIVLGAHGGHYVSTMVLGTTAERVVRKGDRPVLIVKRDSTAPYSTVLIATDFSEHSERALELATLVAPDAEWHLAHVHDAWYLERLNASGISDHAMQELQGALQAEARTQTDRMVQRLGLPADRVHLHVRLGYPGTEVPRLAEKLGAELVSVGARGLTPASQILLGSVSEHVMREADCDVLVVR